MKQKKTRKSLVNCTRVAGDECECYIAYSKMYFEIDSRSVHPNNFVPSFKSFGIGKHVSGNRVQFSSCQSPAT